MSAPAAAQPAPSVMPPEAHGISFTPTPEDAGAIVAFARLDWNRGRRWALLALFPVLMLLLALVVLPALRGRPADARDGWVAALAILAGGVAGFLVQRAQMDRAAKRFLATHGKPHRVTLSGAGLAVATPDVDYTRTWPSIQQVREARGLLLFIVSSPAAGVFQASYVPARAFTDPAAHAAFRDAALHHWKVAHPDPVA